MKKARISTVTEIKNEILQTEKRIKQLEKSMPQSSAAKLANQKLLDSSKATLKRAQAELSRLIKLIEGIEDSHTRNIITLSLVDGVSYRDIAQRIGGYNTADSVRKTVERFLKRNGR